MTIDIVAGGDAASVSPSSLTLSFLLLLQIAEKKMPADSTSSSAPAPPPLEEIYDLLSIGFGPASLAIAIALAEHNSNAPCPQQPTYSSLGGLQDALGFDSRQEAATSERAQRHARIRRTMRVGFLEKHERFRWHPGMMIEGSTMQISFLKDLATLRNPQSPYTFLSYLASFSPSRLVSFVSLSTFTPSRREFADYLQWCAEKVEKETAAQGGTVSYGEEVVAVEAVREEELSVGDVRILRVTSRNTATGEVTHRLTRNLVVSTGGAPRMPPQLSTPELHSSPRILHTSSFVEKIDSILSSVLSSPPPTRPLRFAVIGAGQSSAECFLALRSRLAAVLPSDTKQRPEIEMLFRSSSLRPTDEGPFSNEVFDPAMSQAMFRLGEGDRKRVLDEAKSTNYSIVNPKKLDEVFETMYMQRVEEDISARSSASSSNIVLDPHLALKPFSELVSASVDLSSSAVTLTLHNPILGETREVEYDAVICGTGYDRQAWRQILFPSASSDAATMAENSSSIPLKDLFPTKGEEDEGHSPSPLSTPPSLDLPETAFSSRRLPSAASFSTDGTSSSRSPSSARDSSLSSPRHPASTAASSPPPSPGSSKERASQVTEAKADKPLYPVAENYRLLLPERTKTGGAFRPTVWMQGSCEKTHGISDSLLSVLAVRSGEVVQSILREGNFETEAGEEKKDVQA
ncbi:hypothetical protein JCM11251_003204 [Rhodosporidiobolus azoricus]